MAPLEFSEAPSSVIPFVVQLTAIGPSEVGEAVVIPHYLPSFTFLFRVRCSLISVAFWLFLCTGPLEEPREEPERWTLTDSLDVLTVLPQEGSFLSGLSQLSYVHIYVSDQP